MKLVELKTAEDRYIDECYQDALRSLDEWKELLKENGCQGLMLIATFADGRIVNKMTKCNNYPAMLGSIEVAKFDFMENNS